MKATPAYSSDPLLDTRSAQVENVEEQEGGEVAMSVVTTPSPATLSATPVATQAGLVSESFLGGSEYPGYSSSSSSSSSSTGGEYDHETMSGPRNMTRSLVEMILGSEVRFFRFSFCCTVKKEKRVRADDIMYG